MDDDLSVTGGWKTNMSEKLDWGVRINQLSLYMILMIVVMMIINLSFTRISSVEHRVLAVYSWPTYISISATHTHVMCLLYT